MDIAVEALGKPQTFLQCVQSVKDGGKAVMIGLSQAGSVGEIDINRLVRRKVIARKVKFILFSQESNFVPFAPKLKLKIVVLAL